MPAKGQPLATINVIWIGNRMGPIHAACLSSFLQAGHSVTLHGYGPPEDLPDGIAFSDARKLLPEEYFFRHKRTGSLAPFCDLLRYEILGQGLGLYVDCDVYCIRPIPDADYIFGIQPGATINNAVLKLPVNCPALRDLLAIKDKRHFSPPWQSWRRRLKWRLQSPLGRGRLSDLPYGTTGPDAVTWYLRRHRLEERARAEDVFYPVSPYEIGKVLDPDLPIEKLITENTLALHLYNEALRKVPTDNPPAGSALHHILA